MHLLLNVLTKQLGQEGISFDESHQVFPVSSFTFFISCVVYFSVSNVKSHSFK